MTLFAMRAEAQIDVDTFFELAVKKGISIGRCRIDCDPLNGVEMEFDTPFELEELLAVIATVPDGHVMYRTLHQGDIAGSSFDVLRREP